MKSLPIRIGLSLGCLVGLFCLGIGWIWFFLIPNRFTVGKYDLGTGIEVELFIEDGWDLGDYNQLYYRVEKNGRELVHKTHLESHDRSDPIDLVQFQTDDDSLVGIHSKPGCFVFLIIDLESGESWPRLKDNEALTPVVQAKWNQRYSRLKADNPDLPCSNFFETSDTSPEATATSSAPQL